jgi:hypothetical protein
MKDHPNFPKIGSLGLKICHLVTLSGTPEYPCLVKPLTYIEVFYAILIQDFALFNLSEMNV